MGIMGIMDMDTVGGDDLVILDDMRDDEEDLHRLLAHQALRAQARQIRSPQLDLYQITMISGINSSQPPNSL
jgi:hypothetical protein